uniref:GGDEF domain-containing protein n=1 Tax=Fervidobacterium thailandense TaxID=1008305 RepID=A0A7C5RJ83_9BACT
MGYLRYYLVALLLSIVAFTTLFFLFFWSISFESSALLSWQVVEDRAQVLSSQGESLQKFYVTLRAPTTILLRTKIDDTRVPEDLKKSRYLYIPQADCSYLRVYVNGHFAGSVGLHEKRTGHFWYQPFLFELPPDAEEIAIVMSGIYELGIDFGAFLVDEQGAKKFSILYFLTNTLLNITIGLSTTIGTVLLIISATLTGERKKSYLYLGIASIFGAIWMFDLVQFYSLGNPTSFLIARKLFVTSAYLGFAFLILGFSYFGIEKKFAYKLFILANLILAFILWIPPTNYSFKILTNLVAVSLFFNAGFVFLETIKSSSRVLFGFVSFFVLTIVHDGIVMFLSLNLKLLSNFGVASLFAGFSYTLVQDYRELLVKLTIAHTRSLTDQLTGAYNRGILTEQTFTEEDTFVYIDLDNFKEINDNYGHDVGDMVLKSLVESIKRNVRKSDLIVRMGGDEFLVVLKSCEPSVAERIVQIILKDFSSSHELRPQFSFGVVRFSGNLRNTLRDVDKAMYELKTSKKLQAKKRAE